MPLTTFGAVMGFAAEMMKQTEETYKTLALKAKDHTLKEALEALAIGEGQNHDLMVNTRRENVTEMILEPVSGLEQEDYEIDLKNLDQRGDSDLLKVALILEERGKKFFQDASTKLSLPEVGRIFRKITQKKDQNLARLQGLGLSKTFEKKN